MGQWCYAMSESHAGGMSRCWTWSVWVCYAILRGREGEKGEVKDRIPITGPESALLYISAVFTDPWRALSNVINSLVKL